MHRAVSLGPRYPSIRFATAALYAKASSPQREDGVKLVKRLSLTKGCTVLDLGCGTGYLTNTIAELVGPDGKVIGLDPDAERIRVAREAYGNTSNVQFLKGDEKCLPQGPYDIVIANYVVHWIANKDPVFKNVFENLKIDGRFGINAAGIPKITRDVEAVLPKGATKMSDWVYPLTLIEYDRLAAKYKFLIDFHCEKLNTYRFSGIEEFLEWLHATSGGLINHHSIDKAGLDMLRSQYDKNSIQFTFPQVTCVYRKVVA